MPHLDIQYVFTMNELSTNNGLTSGSEKNYLSHQCAK